MSKRGAGSSESIVLIVALTILTTMALGLAALDAGTMLLTAVGLAIMVLALRLLRRDDPPEGR